MKKARFAAMALAFALLLAGTPALAWQTEAYDAFASAYTEQAMPDPDFLPPLSDADAWEDEAPEDPLDQYPYDTVTLYALQGVWYSEYEDSAGWYQDVLIVDEDYATLFETVDGLPSTTWNGMGPASIETLEYDENRFIPELIVRMESGVGEGGVAGIAITWVGWERFYDALFDRWFVLVEPEGGWSEGNCLFTIHGGAVRKIEGGYAFAPFSEEGVPEELILDADTELVHPENLDGCEPGDTALEWIGRLMARDPYYMSLSGVYDADVTGNHIDRVYGLYWWD